MTGTPLDVWVDTDPALGVPRADVDDALALVQAFRSPELRVRGVSAVFGNAPLATAFPIAVELGRRFGPPGLPVLQGAGGAAELGERSDAVDGLARALGEHELHVLALGPVTNVASLLQLHPELAPRIRSIVVVAARRPGQCFRSVPAQPTPFPDFNFECDPAAMQRLLASPCPLVFAPWELSSQVWITRSDLERLAAGGGSGAFLAERARDWLALWESELGAPGFNPFDSLAVAWLTHPHWIEHFRCGVWIDAGAADAARSGEHPPPQLLVDPARSDPARWRQALYCHRPHPFFKPLLLERIGAAAHG